MFAVALLGACGPFAEAPPCPFPGPGDEAPSAGCFTAEDGKLLVVRDRKDRLSPPGGGAERGESAQCTAHRETWGETGLSLQPRELLAVFDTGFHLYRCERTPQSGGIDPPERFEVNGAFFIAPGEFTRWEWRFPGQQVWLLQKLRELTASTTPDDDTRG